MTGRNGADNYSDTDKGVLDEENLEISILPTLGVSDWDYGFFEEVLSLDSASVQQNDVHLVPNGRGYAELSIQVKRGDGRPAPGVRVNFDVQPVRPLSYWRNVNQLAPKFRSNAQKFRSRVSSGKIKLLGTLNRASAVTDSRGIASTTYSVSHIGGNQAQMAQERVFARMGNDSVSWNINIGFDDLVSIQSVRGGLRIVGATGKHIHRDLRQWLLGLGNAIKQANWPQPATITAGTLRWGGLYPPHFTHTRGASLDFRPMSTDGNPTECHTSGSHSPNYDRARTKALISVFKNAGATKIFFNDPETRSDGASPLAGHHNHIHVSWLNSSIVSAKTLDFSGLSMDGSTADQPLPDYPLGPDASSSDFKLDIVIAGGLSKTQEQAFAQAAARWSEIIVGDLPPAVIDGVEIDDILIEAKGVKIDGPGSVLGRAGPTHIRTIGGLPIKGIMEFDSDDLAQMEQNGTLTDVILHEMGHVLGIGTLWSRMSLLSGSGTMNPVFTGANSKREYGDLLGTSPESVPVANTGGPGTREGHWREHTFGAELMTGFLSGNVRPLSKLTVACLEDMGYSVNYEAADPFTLPTLQELAALGVFGEASECELCRIDRPTPIEVGS